MKFGDPAFARALRRAVKTTVDAEPALRRERRSVRRLARRAFKAPLLYRLLVVALGPVFLWAQPVWPAEFALAGLGTWWWLACVLFRAAQVLGALERGPAWAHAIAYPLAPERQWPHLERTLLVGAALTTVEFALAYALVTRAGTDPARWLHALLYGANLGWLALGAAFALGASLRAGWSVVLQGAAFVSGAVLFGGLWLSDKSATVRLATLEPVMTFFANFTPAGVLTRLSLAYATLDRETVLAGMVLLVAVAVATWWGWNEYRARALAAFRRQIVEFAGEDALAQRHGALPGEANAEADPDERRPAPAGTDGAETVTAAAHPTQAEPPTRYEAEQLAARLREALAGEPAAALTGHSQFLRGLFARLPERRRFVATLVWRTLPSWQRTATGAAVLVAFGWAANLLWPTPEAGLAADWSLPVLACAGLLVLRTVPVFTAGWRAFTRPDAPRAVPWHAFHPVGFGELSRTILAVEVVRAALAWPWFVLFAGVSAQGFAHGPEIWLGVPTLATVAAIALQPLRLIFAYSGGSNDTRTVRGGLFIVALLSAGGVALAGAVMLAGWHGFAGVALGAVLLNGVTFGAWAAYGRLFRRATWDLVVERR